MKRSIGPCTLELVQGDITQQQVDAIVNAANEQLVGGGGVDGAIHRAAGPGLLEETKHKYPEGCPTGGAVITSAGQISCKHIIHAVGPRYLDGRQGEPLHLAGAHTSSLELARKHECKSVAVPAISCGVYGYPIVQAAMIALTTVIQSLQQHEDPKLVRFVLFDEETFETFQMVLESLDV